MLGKFAPTTKHHQPQQSTRTPIPPSTTIKNRHQRFDQLNSHEYFPNEAHFYPAALDPAKKYSTFHEHSYPPNLYKHYYPTTKFLVPKRQHKFDLDEHSEKLSLLDKLNPFKCEEDESEDYEEDEET